jgi:predicted dehydrogenase
MIGVAQIGVGYWGPNLLRNLVANRRCRVKTVVELSEERRSYVQDYYPSIRVTDRFDEVLSDDGIHAVVIATPVASHFNLVVQSLEAGKHVLVEKPMARNVREVELIGQTAEKAGRIAMVGHTFLFNNAVRYIKTLIDSGELGEIRYIYSQRLNLGRIRSDVDALWNFAPHDVSIIQFWLGNLRPANVIKQGVDYIQNGIDDVTFMNVIYPNKIMANIHVSWLDPRKIRTMTIVGSRKMVVYDDISDTKVMIYDKGVSRKAILGQHMDYDNQYFPIFNYRSGDILMPKVDMQEPLKMEIEHFLDCIENKSTCIADANHAKTVVEILCS